MARRSLDQLSRRERQIVDLVYSMKQGSVADVREGIRNPPSYSAVRTTLTILVRKGVLQQKKSGRKYLYAPTLPQAEASRMALQGLLLTYFEGSVEQAVAGLIQADRKKLGDQDYARLIRLIEEARNKEKDR
jgi:BlaI family transcriptional regulator, penicillinase repressor